MKKMLLHLDTICYDLDMAKMSWLSPVQFNWYSDWNVPLLMFEHFQLYCGIMKIV